VLDLLPATILARAAGIDLPSGAAEAAERAARRVDRGLRAELRADAVRSGRADGYHHSLGRSLRAAVRIDVRAPVADAYESTSLPVVIAEDMMRPTARARPIEPRGTPLPETADGHNDMDTSPIGEIAEQQNLLNAPASWRRAVIRIHQDRSGAIVRVTLVSSSGRRSIDEAALDAARRARARRPPARVVGDRTEITSDWAVEIGDVASSPGVLGCTDDGECAALGRGITRIRVELLDVDDAMLGDAEE
jgi:TonB family protein